MFNSFGDSMGLLLKRLPVYWWCGQLGSVIGSTLPGKASASNLAQEGRSW